ncbi:hypothetical protein EON68_02770, partial [archaeon]
MRGRWARNAAAAAACAEEEWVYYSEWTHMLNRRLCLALVWLCDGVGPLPEGAPFPCSRVLVQPLRGTNEWLMLSSTTDDRLPSLASLGSAATSAAPLSRRAGESGGAGGVPVVGLVSLRLPRFHFLLPCFSFFTHLVGHPRLRYSCSFAIEALVHRVLLRVASLASRLVWGVTAVVGHEALQTLLRHCQVSTHLRMELEAHFTRMTGTVCADDVWDAHVDGLNPRVIAQRAVTELRAAAEAAAQQQAMHERAPESSGGTPAAAGAVPPIAAPVPDVETLQALATLLHPQSIVMQCMETAMHTMCHWCRLPGFARFAAATYDAALHRSDVLRALTHTLASVATSELYIYAMHGVARAPAASSSQNARSLKLPLPRRLVDMAVSALQHLLRSVSSRGTAAGDAPPLPLPSTRLQEAIANKRMLTQCGKVFNDKPARGVE